MGPLYQLLGKSVRISDKLIGLHRRAHFVRSVNHEVILGMLCLQCRMFRMKKLLSMASNQKSTRRYRNYLLELTKLAMIRSTKFMMWQMRTRERIPCQQILLYRSFIGSSKFMQEYNIIRE